MKKKKTPKNSVRTKYSNDYFKAFNNERLYALSSKYYQDNAKKYFTQEILKGQAFGL